MIMMHRTLDVLEYSISDILSDILKRQYFLVYTDENIYMASVCLIPAIEAYIDGVVVLEDNKPLGVIGSKHVLQAYYNEGNNVFYKKAKDVMYEIDKWIDEYTSLYSVIDYLKAKRIGFAPIVKDNSVIAVISFRDILRLIAKSRLDIRVSNICSTLITVDPYLNLKDALEIMFSKNIRRVVIRENDNLYFISDRDILGFLMDNEFGEDKYKDPLEAPLIALNKHKLLKISPDTTISEAAREIMKQKAPPSLLVDDNYIVTPLDIIRAIP
jgi:CBS domain-containing protein